MKTASEGERTFCWPRRRRNSTVRASPQQGLRQVQALPNAPDITTLKGLRARAITAVPPGCALCPSAVAALAVGAVRADSRRR